MNEIENNQIQTKIETEYLQKLQTKIKQFLIPKEKHQIESIIGRQCKRILFNSLTYHWEINQSELFDQIRDKSNILIVIETIQFEKFGIYLENPITQIGKYHEDPNAFLFKFTEMDVEIYRIKERTKAIMICENNDDYLFVIGFHRHLLHKNDGDIVVMKRNLKNQSFCFQNSFEYNGKINALLGRKGTFDVNKIGVIETVSKETIDNKIKLKIDEYIENERRRKQEELERIENERKRKHEEQTERMGKSVSMMKEWILIDSSDKSFDSSECNWNNDLSDWFKDIKNKQNNLFVIENENQEIFGCYLDHYSNECFMICFESHEKFPHPIKFDVKNIFKSSIKNYRSIENKSIQIGDILLEKDESDKLKGSWKTSTLFNYNENEKNIIDQHYNKFTVERLMIFQFERLETNLIMDFSMSSFQCGYFNTRSCRTETIQIIDKQKMTIQINYSKNGPVFVNDDKHTVYNFHQLIGVKRNDPYVNRWINQGNYDDVDEENDYCILRVYDEGRKRRKMMKPEQILLDFLRYINEQIRMKISISTNTQIVVKMIVPSYWNETQLQLIHKTSKLSGFIISSFVPRPLAILDIYQNNSKKKFKNKNIIIFDISEILIEMTFIKTNKRGKIENKPTYMNLMELSGYDIIDNFIERIKDEIDYAVDLEEEINTYFDIYPEDNDIVKEEKRTLKMKKKVIEIMTNLEKKSKESDEFFEIMINLKKQSDEFFEIDERFDSKTDSQIFITREMYEDQNEILYDDWICEIDNHLHKNNIKANEIHHVIFIGDIIFPIFYERFIQCMFPRATILNRFDSDEILSQSINLSSFKNSFYD